MEEQKKKEKVLTEEDLMHSLDCLVSIFTEYEWYSPSSLSDAVFHYCCMEGVFQQQKEGCMKEFKVYQKFAEHYYDIRFAIKNLSLSLEGLKEKYNY